MVGKRADGLRRRTRLLAVAHRLVYVIEHLSLQGRGRLLQHRHLEEPVGRPGDEEKRTSCASEIHPRVPLFQPLAPLSAHVGKSLRPRGPVCVEPAAIDRGRPCESVVDARRDAGQISSPGNSRNADSIWIDLGERPQEGMCPDHISDGVIRPLVSVRLVDLPEPAPTRRTAPVVAHPRLAPIRFLPRHSTACIHRNRRVTALVPHPHPPVERSPCAAVDEHDGWALVRCGGAFRNAIPRKKARLPTTPVLAVEEYGLRLSSKARRFMRDGRALLQHLAPWRSNLHPKICADARNFFLGKSGDVLRPVDALAVERATSPKRQNSQRNNRRKQRRPIMRISNPALHFYSSIRYNAVWNCSNSHENASQSRATTSPVVTS